MKITALLLGICCLISAPGADAASKDAADVEVIILRLEHLKFDAQQRKDTVVLNAMLDDAIMWVDPNGALFTKAAYLTGLHDSNLQLQRVFPESITVKVFDGTAIVVGIYDEKGLINGRPYHQRCRFIDTWAWKQGKWVCIGATASPVIS